MSIIMSNGRSTKPFGLEIAVSEDCVYVCEPKTDITAYETAQLALYLSIVTRVGAGYDFLSQVNDLGISRHFRKK